MSITALSLLASPALAQDASVELKDPKGEVVGKATLTDTEGGLLISLNLTGLPPGTHALHIHETGKCEPPDFKSAGGHFNPFEYEHGFLNPEGAHAGDMPNIIVPESGKLQIEVMNAMVSLQAYEEDEDEEDEAADDASAQAGAEDDDDEEDEEAEAVLLDDDGSALVIHAGPDDYKTDPAGDAGERLACGVITE